MLLHSVGLVHRAVVCYSISWNAWPLLSELRSLSLLIWRHDNDLIFAVLREYRYIVKNGVAWIRLDVFGRYVWIDRLVRGIVSLLQLSARSYIVDTALVAYSDVLIAHCSLRVRDSYRWVSSSSCRRWPARSSFVFWPRYTLYLQRRLCLPTRIVALRVRLMLRLMHLILGYL